MKIVKLKYEVLGLDCVLERYRYRAYLQAWYGLFGARRVGMRWYEGSDGTKRPLRVTRLSREQFDFYKGQVAWWQGATAKAEESGVELAIRAAETQLLVSEMVILLV